MPNPNINFANVNISIQQFQAVSTGEVNAGEVRLLDEHTIDKVNHHVHQRGSNGVTLSHDEVLAIKSAFIRSLSDSGVDAAEINRVRQQLGLAPMKSADLTLRKRSITPLSRQQIRVILDRNADAINAHEGAGTIRTSEQLQAGLGRRTVQSRRESRESTNADLSNRRALDESQRVAIFQSVIAGDVDFHDEATRRELLAMAKRCLETVLVRCQGQPRPGQPCEIRRRTASGPSITMDTGLDEVGFVRKMEDIIVRLSRSTLPRDDVMAARREFKALATPQARVQWIGQFLGSEAPEDAVKARTVAVMILHDRGVTDAETLSIANRLDNGTAIAFAINLVQSCMGLRGDALRNSSVVQSARELIDPQARISPFGLTYLPVLTDREFNAEIASNLDNSPEKLPESFQILLRSATAEMRARFGADGYPDMAKPSWLLTFTDSNHVTGADNPDAPRTTSETLRAGLMAAAVESSARRFMDAAIERRMGAAGYDTNLGVRVGNSLRALQPQIMERLSAAQSPQEAEAVMNEYADAILQTAHRATVCARCKEAMAGWALEAMGERLGVPPASLDHHILAVKRFQPVGTTLSNDIMNTDHPAKTDAEIEAAFRAEAMQFVDEHAAILDQVDQADIPPEAKDCFKTKVLAMEKVKYINVPVMVAAAKKVSAQALSDLLDANAPRAQVYAAMSAIMAPLQATRDQLLAGARAQGREIGIDELTDLTDPMVAIVVLSHPGLEDKLAKFVARPDVRSDPFTDRSLPESVLLSFLSFGREPGANAALAGQIGTDDLPALHAKALADTVRAEEGLGDLTDAEARALFKPGTPAGDNLRLFVSSYTGTVHPSTLATMARAAIHPAKAAIIAARRDAADAAAATREFLDGPGAARALREGFLPVELPRLAKLYAYYKTATGATAEAALDAILDPAGKAARLMSYGGRFAESVENFRAGLRLLDSFDTWYDTLSADAQAKKTGTPTLLNGNALILTPRHKRSHERFIFEEIAVNPKLALKPLDPEETFGMKNNPATRFVGRNYMNGMTTTLAQIPPARRSLLYALIDALHPIHRTAADKGANTSFSFNTVLASRFMKHYDAVAALRDAGHLDRAHILELLFPDFPFPPNATNQQIYTIQSDTVLALARNEFRAKPQLLGPAQLLLESSGATLPEVVSALLQGRRLPPAPCVSPYAATYESLGTVEGARKTLLGDLHRPETPNYSANGAPAVADANNVFKFHFPDGRTLVSKTGAPGDPGVLAANTAIADKLADLCGKAHPAQLSTLLYSLSQSGLSPLRRGLVGQGIESTEHAPVTFTLSRNAETGDVTIRYSEPDGFPLRFNWQTTVHLDGTTESTPLAIDVPVDFADRQLGADYAQLGGLPPDAPFTSSTIVSGQGPAATALRNLIDTRSGAPEGTTATRKATSFANRLNTYAAKNMAVTFATVASRNLVTGTGQNARVDVEKEHDQFKRDLIGYRYHFPGGEAPSHDYNKVRDRFVQFLTRRPNATFAEASEAVKKRVAVLMSLATQYTASLSQNAVSSSMARPGENPMTYMLLMNGGDGVDFQFAKDPEGNITLTVSSRCNAQMLVLNREDGDPEQHPMPAGSTYQFNMKITLPEDNLAELAEADWTQYDRKAVNDFDGTMDDRVNLIPDPFRFKGTVDLAFHVHEADANAPANNP